MKLYKYLLASLMAAGAMTGFTSCDNDLDYPPVISPDLGGGGKWDAPLTVDGVKAYYTTYYSDVPDANKYYWVTGYIVGCAVTTETVFVANDNTSVFEAPFGSANNLLIAATPDETDYSKCISLQLPSGNVRTSLNLKDTPANLGRMVTVRGYIDKYLGLPGMRAIDNFNWGDTGIDTGEVETQTSAFSLAVEITSGRSYALVANGTAAKTVEGDNSFLKTGNVTIANGKFNESEKYGFLFTETEAGSGLYYICDYRGKFLWQDVFGNGWSNRPSVADAILKDNKGFIWQPVKNDNGHWTIINTASSRILAYDTSYNSYGLYESLTEQYLAPELYEMANDPVVVPDFTPSEGGDIPDVNEGSGEGTLESPYDAVRANAMAKAGATNEVYVEGIVSSIKELSTSFGNATYYISADGTATDQFSIYRGYYFNGDKFTSEDQLKVGDKVVVYGALMNYMGNTPQLAQGNRLISINGQKPEGGDTPDTPASAIYSALGASDAELTAGWEFDNVTLGEGSSYVWSWKVYNNKGYLNASSFVNGAALDSEAYAVSPEIDLTGVTGASVTFDHAAKFQTTLKDGCTICVRESGAADWTALAIPTWPEAGSWTFVNAGTIDLSAYNGKKIQIAFRYISTAAGADTWEINNLVVSGNK